MTEDFGAGVYTFHVPQQSGTEPDASEEVLVAISRQAIGIGGRVECPSFLADGPLRDLFEVIGIDNRFEARLLM